MGNQMVKEFDNVFSPFNTVVKYDLHMDGIYYIKSVAELRNVGDAAYAMSHAAAVAGCRVWHGYRITAYRLAACEC